MDSADLMDIVAAFLRGTKDSVAVVDESGNFLSFIAGSNYEGRTPLQVVGKNIADMVAPEVAARIIAGLRATSVDAPAYSFTHRLTRADVTRELRIKCVRRADGTILGHIADVTDAARAEAAARESFERYRLIARATTDAVFDWDAATDIATWNENLERFGYPASLQTSFQWWIDHIHPDEREVVRASASAALRSPAEEQWEGELRFLCADGTWREVLERCIFLRDERGAVVRVIGAMLDISDRKRMTRKLERSERIVAAATLAAGVGHEIRGPLNYVLGNVALATAALEAGEPERALELLRSVPLGSERLLSIVDELGALARTAGSKTIVDIEAVVGASITMLDARLKTRGAIVVRSDGPAFVEGNATQLGQMVTNILTNALQAIEETADAAEEPGRVVVTVSSTPSSPSAAVIVRIEDNGRGFTAEEAQQAFDPLFTTRHARGGSGLGLAVAHAVVTFHDGHIEAAPRSPRGTAFTITLPRVEKAAAAAAPAVRPRPSSSSPSSPAEPSGRAEEPARVLVVDDDELTLRLVERILSGHQVTRAQGALEALAALAAGDFDVVLSDVAMPVHGGFELRDAVLRLGKPVRFGFLSGDDVGDDAGCPSLRKPFTPEALRRFVREL